VAIDYGRKRIGLAISDATGLLARPWKTIAREGNVTQVAAALAREVAVLREEADGLHAIVIGWPRRLSGEPNDQTAAVEALATALRAKMADLPVILQDERLTSHEAEEQLATREKDWRKRKPLIDAAAAALILQDYLDAQPRRAGAEDAER
jgi:putative Holliday junction resolvase